MGKAAIIDAIMSRDPQAMRAATVGEGIGYIAPTADPRTWDERELETLGGHCWAAVQWQERSWYRDGDDSDTDHDGLTTIVTLGGSRYKTNDVRFDPCSVISRSLDTPPEEDGSPPLQYGETWLVPEGASGEWAGHEDERAMWTARGWKFKPPAHGEITLVEDEGEAGQFIHFNVNDEWDDGLPGNVVDSSVRPSHLLIRSWAVENQTTTSPPALGPAGEQYVIGPAATGAWAGHDGKIAWRPATDASFVITTPFVGELVYDKDLGYRVEWSGTAWISSAGVFVGGDSISATSRTPVQSSAFGAYSWSDTTAPTKSSQNNRSDEPGVLTYQAKRSGAKLYFDYSALANFTTGTATAATGGTADTIVVALFRGSETTALDWKAVTVGPGALIVGSKYTIKVDLECEAMDDDPEDYSVSFFLPIVTGGSPNTYLRVSNVGRPSFKVKERS